MLQLVFTIISCVLTEICRVLLNLPRSCLVLVAYNKTNIPCLFSLISKLFTLGNVVEYLLSQVNNF